MRESARHHGFKQVTRMSPLQFQKQLRLHEARRLISVQMQVLPPSTGKAMPVVKLAASEHR